VTSIYDGNLVVTPNVVRFGVKHVAAAGSHVQNLDRVLTSFYEKGRLEWVVVWQRE
jgi:hypothetical protein